MATKFVPRIAAAAVVFALAASLAPAYGQPTGTAADAKKAAMQHSLTTYLASEGFRPAVDSDGDIVFKRSGHTFFIHLYPKDPTFLQVVLPNILKLDTDGQRQRALVAANHSSMKSKATMTVVTPEGQVWVVWESVLKGEEDYKDVLRRSLNGLENGAANFMSKYREAGASAAADRSAVRAGRS